MFVNKETTYLLTYTVFHLAYSTTTNVRKV